MDTIMSIITRGDDVGECDCVDGREPSLLKKLEEAVRRLKEQTTQVQTEYRQEKFPSGTPPPGFSLDFDFQSEMVDGDTPDTADTLRGDLLDFIHLIVWISLEGNSTTEIEQLVSFISACDRLLMKYSGSHVSSNFDERKEEVMEALSKWRKTRTTPKQKTYDIACRNDAILVQLRKLCTIISEEVKDFPERAL